MLTSYNLSCREYEFETSTELYILITWFGTFETEYIQLLCSLIRAVLVSSIWYDHMVINDTTFPLFLAFYNPRSLRFLRFKRASELSEPKWKSNKKITGVFSIELVFLLNTGSKLLVQKNF